MYGGDAVQYVVMECVVGVGVCICICVWMYVDVGVCIVWVCIHILHIKVAFLHYIIILLFFKETAYIIIKISIEFLMKQQYVYGITTLMMMIHHHIHHHHHHHHPQVCPNRSKICPD